MAHLHADVVEIWAVQVVPGWNGHSTIQHLAHGRRSVLGPHLVVKVVQNDEEMRHPQSHRVESARTEDRTKPDRGSSGAGISLAYLPEHAAELEEVEGGEGARVRGGE